jgi:hypothetical protein
MMDGRFILSTTLETKMLPGISLLWKDSTAEQTPKVMAFTNMIANNVLKNVDMLLDVDLSLMITMTVSVDN